jgi:hypothetical protein
MNAIMVSIFIFISLTAFTQEKQISGQIIKTDSLLPYRYFTVSLRHAGLIIQEAVPDATGKFTLNVQKGFYSLVVKRALPQRLSC